MQHSNLAFDLANRFLSDLEQEPIMVEKKAAIRRQKCYVFFVSTIFVLGLLDWGVFGTIVLCRKISFYRLAFGCEIIKCRNSS